MSVQPQQNYKLLYNYGLISLICVVISAIVIFVFFRYQAVNTIRNANEVSYTAFANVIIDSLGDQLTDYLDEYAQAQKQEKVPPIIFSDLEQDFHRLISNTPITRVKIYDDIGRVIYSTKLSQIGRMQNKNPGYAAAINGEIATKFMFRDTLKSFEEEVGDANLIQIYVPIRDENRKNPIGVFEIYADVNKLVVDTSKIEILVLVFILVIMAALYFILMFYVKRAEKIINKQQRSSREKQKMLEYLFVKMINAQEDEKKRISVELHENVVQTISAVKIYLEQYMNSMARKEENSASVVSVDMVPIMQDAIKKIRSVSLDLRPPSLDNFGLKAAVNTLISDFSSVLNSVELKVKIELPESILSNDKKSIIFRIYKDTLKMLSKHENLKGEIVSCLRFNEDSGNLELVFEISDSVYPDPENTHDFELMRENTILSGGEFALRSASEGKIIALSEWGNL